MAYLFFYIIITSQAIDFSIGFIRVGIGYISFGCTAVMKYLFAIQAGID
jgi:hypothetical protein